MLGSGKTYGIDISFEELRLPLSYDVLVLARNASQGKQGLHKSLDLLAPGTFQLVDADMGTDRIAAVFVNRSLLHKLPAERIIGLLRSHVFDHVAEGDLLQVRMRVRISLSNLTG